VANNLVSKREANMTTTGSAALQSQNRRDAVPTLHLQPGRALRALQRLSEDPDDTAEVFTIIEALSGQAPLRVLARFRKDPAGRQLLAERPKVLSTLIDRPSLERMPVGSLAHAYLAFIDREGITADGLVKASNDGRSGKLDPESDFAFVTDRIRDTHDLWHTVTGYQGDVVGEAALLSFNVAQLYNPGVAAIVVTALLQFRDLRFSRLVGRAFVDGLRAAWLPPAHWEALLPLPLAQVRSLLRIAPTPMYIPLRTSEVRAAMAALPPTEQSLREVRDVLRSVRAA
jgi:ubiquinone biosynthesis protein COQ4